MSDKPNHPYVEPWQGCALAWSEGPRMQDARVCGKPREAHPGQGWQDISTAPKGPSVLVWTGKEVTVARWDAQRFHTKPNPLWRTHMSVSWDRIHQPSHWMPLPEPPK